MTDAARSRQPGTASTFTDGVRAKVKEKRECPCCQRPLTGVRTMAEAIGIQYTTLWYFLRGRDITSQSLDKIMAWLEQQP